MDRIQLDRGVFRATGFFSIISSLGSDVVLGDMVFSDFGSVSWIAGEPGISIGLSFSLVKFLTCLAPFCIVVFVTRLTCLSTQIDTNKVL